MAESVAVKDGKRLPGEAVDCAPLETSNTQLEKAVECAVQPRCSGKPESCGGRRAGEGSLLGVPGLGAQERKEGGSALKS